MIDEISSIAFAQAGEEVSVSDKRNALGLLSKVLGLMVNRQEISGRGGRPLQLDLDASTVRERIAAKLDAIAARLQPPTIDLTPVRAAPSEVPAGRLEGTGERE